MASGIGQKTIVGYGKQTALGAAVAATYYVPVKSVTETIQREDAPDDGAYGHFGKREPFEGGRRVSLEVAFKASPQALCHALRRLCGVPTSTQPDATGAPSVWKHTFKWPKSAGFADGWWGHPYSIEWYRDLQAQSKQFADVSTNTLGLAISVGDKVLAATEGMIGRAFPSNVTKTTESFPTVGPWLFHQLALTIGGSAYNELTDMTLQIDSQLTGDYLMKGSKTIEELLPSDLGTAALSGTARPLSFAEYEAFQSGAARNMVATFTGAVITGSHTHKLVLTLPRVRYTAYPIPYSGPGRLTASWSADVHYDPSAGYAVQYEVTSTVVNTELS